MAEPIRIIVTQGGIGGSPLTGDNAKTPDRKFGVDAMPDTSKLGFTKKEQMAIAGLVIAGSRKTIMNSINNNLAMTGNYIESTRIKDAIDVGTKIAGYGLAGIGIAKAVSSGLMSGPMAAVAVTALVVNEGMNIMQNIKQFEINVNKINYQAERARLRAGTSLANGSRGTND